MHFVHIDDFMHPEAGYQINLLSRLQVQQGHKVTVVTSELAKMPSFLTDFFGAANIEEKDRKFEREAGVKVVRVPLHAFCSGRSIYHSKIFTIVDDLAPDVLFVHGEDTMIGVQMIRRCERLNYPLVLDCHMVEMASENRFREVFRFVYRHFVTPYILRNKIPLIRIVDVDYVQKCLGVPLDRTILLSFGTDTRFFKPDAAAGAQFRATHNIGADDFVVLYAGKLDESKGGRFFARTIKQQLKIAGDRKLVFVVVGNTAGQFGQEVEDTLSQSENRILRFPTQPYYDLARFYQAANIAVFPKQCSMSFFEAQACGVPIVFEDNEINRQRAELGNALIFKAGDTEEFRRQIGALAALDQPAFVKMQEAARRHVLASYDFVPVAQKFSDIMVREAERFRQRAGAGGAKALAEK